MSSAIIEKIKLENFKCHEKLDETLSAITILAGENAAGKSSVIQAILLHNWAFYGDRTRLNTYNIWGNNMGPAPELVSQNGKGNNITISLYINEQAITVELTPKEYDDTVMEVQKTVPQVAHPYNLFYLNAERVAPKLANSITSEGDYYVGIHGQNTAYVMNQMDILMKRPENKQKRIPSILKISSIERFSANVEEWLGVIIPGTKIETHAYPNQGIATIRYNNVGDSFYSPTSTGFGISYVLPIIVQALIASIQSNSVIIIENPEAHLHPYSQSMMGRFLAYIAMAGTQVIVETHSEHFINGCRLQLAKEKKCDIAKILFFSKNGTGLFHEAITLSDKGELSNWPVGFFDQNQQDLRELLKLKLCKK